MVRIAARVWLFGITLLAACSPATRLPKNDPSAENEASPAPILDPDLDWYGDNRAQLEAMLRSLGRGSPGYDSSRPPVAVFDCDNTLIRNDIADAALHWALTHDLLLNPPGGDWGKTSVHLTNAAKTVLASACGAHPDGARLPTSTTPACSDEILAIYEDGSTAHGAPAWVETGYDHRAHVPRYAWLAQLQAGYTAAEIQAITAAAMKAYLAAEVGATRTIGTRAVTAYLRFHEPMRDLVRALGAHGFEVWVVSASPEPNVYPVAERFGVPIERVVGIRVTRDEAGRLTHHLAPCGPNASESSPVVTFMDGKRCWIDQEIFGGPGRLDPHPDPGHRPAFVAGDASTDVSMLLDATVLRLVVNRNKPEVMCHAYHGTGGHWVVNPQFVDPMPRRRQPYPCSTTACLDRDGQPVPCRDSSGAVIPEQEDVVYPAGS